MTEVELQPLALSYLKSIYNIIYSIDCRNFDQDPQILVKDLSKFKEKSFSTTDKILLVHMDTDYYDPLLPCGLIPINVVRIFKNLDIPLHALLFVTNHFGIKKEFDTLLKDQHPADRPKIVETLLSSMLLAENYSIAPIGFDHIEKAAVCMMNRQRSHRVALYNFFVANNLLDKIAVSQNFNDKESFNH